MKLTFQIYEQSTKVTRYVYPDQNVSIPITTRIFMTVRENIFGTWFDFDITQNNILNDQPLYDGEYANNNYIQTVMNTTKNKADAWLRVHEQEYIEKYKKCELNKKSE